jgi:DNA-binding transcriptional MerR regulator
MRLARLSEVSGTSPASIKFYLRTGLLQPGAVINPTRADYDDGHVRRLRLIQGLRSTVGLGLEDIRRITDALPGAEDSPAQRLALLATVQSVVLRLDGDAGAASAAGDALVLAMAWPDETSEARRAVDRHLAVMDAAGVGVGAEVLEAYARAADAIADVQLAATDLQDSVEDVVLTAAVGIHLHNQLILKIIALAQASRSIRRYGAAGAPDAEGPGQP